MLAKESQSGQHVPHIVGTLAVTGPSSPAASVIELADPRTQTTCIGGLPISLLGMRDTARLLIKSALDARGRNVRPFYSTSANGQVIALAAADPGFKDLMLSADQINPDGMPMVMLSGYVSSERLEERVATTDLVHAVAEMAEADEISFYFLGGTAAVNAEAVARMKEKYPKLIFSGARDGYFRRDEEEAVVEEIARLRPDILWIGFGVPNEQQFVSRNLEKLRGVGVVKTSGGLFDFLSGKKSRAPQWMQNCGMEWLYRIILEPRRLLWRYVATNPIAIWHILVNSR